MEPAESSYWGYKIRAEEGDAFPRARRTDWWFFVSDGETQQELFALQLIEHHPWSDVLEPAEREAEVREAGLELARGLISTGSFTSGETTNRTRPGIYEPTPAEDEQALEALILRAFHRMQRRAVGRSGLFWMDVPGLAAALDVPTDQVGQLIGDLVSLGDLEPNHRTLGTGPEDGAARITGRGLQRLRSQDAASAARSASSVPGVWGALQSRLTEALAETGLGEYLQTIEEALSQHTTAGDRSALYGCRSLLDALATHLWRDTRATYPKLPGDGVDGKLKVTPDRWMNRLGAFINERVKSEKASDLLAAELERIWNSLDALGDLASKGHDSGAQREDAEFAAASVYLLVAELARRTDLRPIETYD